MCATRPSGVRMYLKILAIVVFACVAAFPGPLSAEESVEGGARKVGAGFKEAGKSVGRQGKKVGRATKAAAKDTGKAVKKTTKDIGRGLKKAFE